jgi:superfamily I DNA and RNA helicase
MDFVATLPSFATDTVARTVWSWFRDKIGEEEGVAFYKYPNVGGPGLTQPDLTIVTRRFDPLVIRCLSLTTDEILGLTENTWSVHFSSSGEELIDSPLLEVDDIAVAMQEKFDRERPLRKLFKVRPVLALPLVDRSQFEARFGPHHGILWDALGVPSWLTPASRNLDSTEWRLTQSVVQAAVPLSKHRGPRVVKAPTNLREALDVIENDIALLDMEQQLAATQIPPGPQRIRGLAGTGKTVLLALKAANIHRQFPDARILFTFNTQSLYSQAQNLIGRFYRHFSGVEPDFQDKLHVRHAWGGKKKAGVYSDACKRTGISPLDFLSAKGRNKSNPFGECCKEVLQHGVMPFYDYSLIDEAQDFPREFFRLVYAVTKGGSTRPIYFAYDELQSLSAIEVPTASELFGSDANGQPLISLDGEYPGPIDKDFVLHKSYRCPRNVLMIAHALGLGIYRPKGPVQMLSNVDSWSSVGYEVKGNLKQDELVEISRPDANSPNRIEEIFPQQSTFQGTTFSTREEELENVAKSIQINLTTDGLKPEEIVVISLDSRSARSHMASLQSKLWSRGISSIVPGFTDDQDIFAEKGMVTLATVHRAKGNEAPLVYIISFESLFDYVEEIENRNKAFTAISRSKAWVRISGIGPQMETVKKEIQAIQANLPSFKFKFPNMQSIRRLDASETTRRKNTLKKTRDLASRLNETDIDAIKALDPQLLEMLRRKLDEATNETE